VGGMGTGGTSPVSAVTSRRRTRASRSWAPIRSARSSPSGSTRRRWGRPHLQDRGHRRGHHPTATLWDQIDRIIKTTDHEAYNWARRVSREEGILIGSSGGAAITAALTVARELDERHVIVVLLPDTGERYLTKVHSDEWMRDNRLLDTHFVRVGDVLRKKSKTCPRSSPSRSRSRSAMRSRSSAATTSRRCR